MLAGSSRGRFLRGILTHSQGGVGLMAQRVEHHPLDAVLSARGRAILADQLHQSADHGIKVPLSS